jgi:hypothetical protein
MIMPQSNQPAENSEQAQIASVVVRLQEFLTEYLAEAGKLGISVKPKQILAAIDESIKRCQTKQSSLPAEESVEAFFLDGLSAALAEEQQGIYEKRKNEEGEEVYLVVSDEVWLECLTALRASAGKLS